MTEKRKKILIIDDEFKDEYGPILPHLQQRWEIIPAANRQEAIAVVNTVRVDLIILDLMLDQTRSVSAGYALLYTLNNLYKYTVPILVASKNDEFDTYKKCLDGKAAGYLYKGNYEPATYLSEIEDLLTHFTDVYPKTNFINSRHQSVTSVFERLNALIKKLHAGLPILICAPEYTELMAWLGHLRDVLNIDELQFPVHNLNKKNLQALVNQRKLPKFIIASGLEKSEPEAQDTIQELIRKGVQFIILSTVNLEKFVQTHQIRPSLYHRLFQFNLPHFQHREGDIEPMITEMLKLRTVCPVHKRTFYNQTHEVFHRDAIQKLKTHQWEDQGKSLYEVLQYAIWCANARKLNMITTDLIDPVLQPVRSVMPEDERLKDRLEEIDKNIGTKLSKGYPEEVFKDDLEKIYQLVVENSALKDYLPNLDHFKRKVTVKNALDGNIIFVMGNMIIGDGNQQ